LPLSESALVNAGEPEQVLSVYTLKVTVPVGEAPPETVAESVNVPPRFTDVVDNVVDTLGVTLPTVTTSAVQGLDALLLFESPL